MQGCCVLILSCDKYQDLWKPFFQQFWKNWPDCPYPVYLGSNTVSYTDDKRVKTLLSGKDIDWSSSFISILKQTPEENIFIWLDDAFMTSSVNNNVMNQCFGLLKNKGAQHIHDKPKIPPDTLAFGGKFGKYEKEAPYRVTAVGFWKKRSLLKLLLPGESAWRFEIYGSYRSGYEEGYYCPTKRLFEYKHVVEKGKFSRDALNYCKQNNVHLDTKIRDSMSPGGKLKSDIQDIYFKWIIRTISWKRRTSLMWVLRKILVSY